MKNILVTGGAGFIGSHTVCQLLNSNYDVTVLDNLSNSSLKSLEMIERITNKKIEFFNCDLCDISQLNLIFSKKKYNAVIHFAGLKSVRESVQYPISYYINNFSSTLNLIDAMVKYNVKNIVFSSSATVYGDNQNVPYKEDHPFGETASPYASTKVLIEKFLKDVCLNTEQINGISLRYFNPIGAHESGLLGEDPKGIPNNIMPYITQVAVGKLEKLMVFGNDYETPDGTCLRDYFHVMDLADGHISALKKLEQISDKNFYDVFNLGSGSARSVLELIESFSEANSIKIDYEFSERRPGDLPEVWADTSKAEKELSWKIRRSFQDMMKDSWNWQKKNPEGYK